MGVGIVLLMGSLRLARCFMQRDVRVSNLLVGLKPKLWMTACLGIFFFSLYAMVVVLGAYFLDDKMRQFLFHSARDNPVLFIYGGLLVFMGISIGIIAVRSAIKRVYTHYN